MKRRGNVPIDGIVIYSVLGSEATFSGTGTRYGSLCLRRDGPASG